MMAIAIFRRFDTGGGVDLKFGVPRRKVEVGIFALFIPIDGQCAQWNRTRNARGENEKVA